MDLILTSWENNSLINVVEGVLLYFYATFWHISTTYLHLLILSNNVHAQASYLSHSQFPSAFRTSLQCIYLHLEGMWHRHICIEFLFCLKYVIHLWKSCSSLQPVFFGDFFLPMYPNVKLLCRHTLLSLFCVHEWGIPCCNFVLGSSALHDSKHFLLRPFSCNWQVYKLIMDHSGKCIAGHFCSLQEVPSMFPDRVISVRGEIDHMSEAEAAISGILRECYEKEMQQPPLVGTCSTLVYSSAMMGPVIFMWSSAKSSLSSMCF